LLLLAVYTPHALQLCWNCQILCKFWNSGKIFVGAGFGSVTRNGRVPVLFSPGL